MQQPAEAKSFGGELDWSGVTMSQVVRETAIMASMKIS
jgi:hypothetical protein